MLAADAQKKLGKASVDTRNLSEELKSLKGNFSINKALPNLIHSIKYVLVLF